MTRLFFFFHSHWMQWIFSELSGKNLSILQRYAVYHFICSYYIAIYICVCVSTKQVCSGCHLRRRSYKPPFLLYFSLFSLSLSPSERAVTIETITYCLHSCRSRTFRVLFPFMLFSACVTLTSLCEVTRRRCPCTAVLTERLFTVRLTMSWLAKPLPVRL